MKKVFQIQIDLDGFWRNDETGFGKVKPTEADIAHCLTVLAEDLLTRKGKLKDFEVKDITSPDPKRILIDCKILNIKE